NLLDYRPTLGGRDVPPILWRAAVWGPAGAHAENARENSVYYSLLVLPPGRRRAIVAVWDFCRAVDDAVDEPPAAGAPPSGHDAVTFWRGELARSYNRGPPQTAPGPRRRPL